MKETFQKNIFLDHAATTPVHPDVLDAMLPFLASDYGNPSSLHSLGRKAKQAVEAARVKVADLIGADPGEIVFTSGGTEADNLAVQGAVFGNLHKGRHIITSTIEHPAVLNVCHRLRHKGFSVTYLSVDSHGIVSADDVKEAIRNDTILISIMHGNNETGSLQPVQEIGTVAKENGILFHTDAVQSMGKIPVSVRDLNVDLMSMSAHKIYGPKGIGALWVKKNTRIAQLLHGGSQEMNVRPGTENVPAIAGFGKACEISALMTKGDAASHLRHLRDHLERAIAERIPSARINGHPQKRLPQILSVSFPSLEGLSIVDELDAHGICASGGAACSTGKSEPSHVLLAMNVPPEEASGTVRFSLGFENTEQDIDYTADILGKAVDRLYGFKRGRAKGAGRSMP
jgi:cysteine desulfurase